MGREVVMPRGTPTRSLCSHSLRWSKLLSARPPSTESGGHWGARFSSRNYRTQHRRTYESVRNRESSWEIETYACWISSCLCSGGQSLVSDSVPVCFRGWPAGLFNQSGHVPRRSVLG